MKKLIGSLLVALALVVVSVPAVAVLHAWDERCDGPQYNDYEPWYVTYYSWQHWYDTVYTPHPEVCD